MTAERGVLVALGGDCKTPMGAHAERVGGSLRLRAFVANEKGSALRRAEREAPWPANATEAHDMGLSVGRTLF